MATREIASKIGDNMTELGRDTRQRTSRLGQDFLDRMLRATGRGANSAGSTIKTSAYDMADALPINKERTSTRRTRLALGAMTVVGAGTIYKFRQQIGQRIDQIRNRAAEEIARDDASQETVAGAPASTTAQAPAAMPPHPTRPAAEQPATTRPITAPIESSPS